MRYNKTHIDVTAIASLFGCKANNGLATDMNDLEEAGALKDAHTLGQIMDVLCHYHLSDKTSTESPTLRLTAEIDKAERKAIDALSRYKFQMFGYWAGIWVHLNRIEGKRRPSPFTDLVKSARTVIETNPKDHS